jgi:hypothetical protein
MPESKMQVWVFRLLELMGLAAALTVEIVAIAYLVMKYGGPHG